MNHVLSLTEPQLKIQSTNLKFDKKIHIKVYSNYNFTENADDYSVDLMKDK